MMGRFFRNLMRLSRITLGLICGLSICDAENYPWQQNYARVTQPGDIEWTPQPFRFEAGKKVRYIDYEAGSDDQDGSRDFPWKHHPWDEAATGMAAADYDTDTFVFKGGSIYRGSLVLPAGADRESRVRLTRDPDWGVGPAVIAGSERVKNWKQESDHKNIPGADQVWVADLDFAPRALWRREGEHRSLKIPLARHPNWKSQPEDYKAEWFTWTNEPHPFRRRDGFSANDSKNLKGVDPDFVNGALIYSEFGWVIGTPYPSKIHRFNPENGAVLFEKWTGGNNAEKIFRGMRYYLEDKPQYLDDPEGEFWFEKKGRGGRLYLRLPEGMDPNTVRIEVGKRAELISGSDVRHLEISGLDFRWTTPPWNLDVVIWDFSSKPWGTRKSATPACIRIFGTAEDVTISNCNFEDGVMGVRMQSEGEGAGIRDIRIQDSTFRNLDTGAVSLSDGARWGFARVQGRLDDIGILRNHAENIGFRATRFERGCSFYVQGVRLAHIAGNVVLRSGAQGINVVAGKANGIRDEIPLIRILIHQNKVWKTMQNANDFGGIEVWQHGPVYIFNNLSYDARGQWEARRVFHGEANGFGHAYYLDGGFKCYLFNNIAWGLSNDPASPLVNCAAFQGIHGFQNMFLNNTAYNFTVGSRRQAPQAGNNKYLGNIWSDISERVFRHAFPADMEAEGNAADVGTRKEIFAYESNAYAANVFYKVSEIGVFESSGKGYQHIADFQAALKQKQSQVCDVGIMDKASPLVDPANGDFRLNRASAAIDQGSVAFVPWALYGVVAEWNFYPAGNDPAKILDEHWYANEYLAERKDYELRPGYPLTVVNGSLADYESGPLENFIPGALALDPGRRMYARVADELLDRPYTVSLNQRANHGQDPLSEKVTFKGKALKTPEIHDGNFLIEMIFKADADGLLVSKRKGAGYAVQLEDGKAVFELEDQEGNRCSLMSKTKLRDGKWHHLVVEADRGSVTLNLYVDGQKEATGTGFGKVSLANDADLFVGGTPEGNWLKGTFEFLRIAQGTLLDSRTTIGELHEWQFHGPFLRDMRGADPKGGMRDAGALERE